MSHEPLPTDALDYDLPPSLIATRPASPRDSARLMVVPLDHDEIIHATVRELPSFLKPTDTLVFNDTSVVPARFEGRRHGSGGRIEGLFLDEVNPGRWRVMLRSNGRLRDGLVIEIGEPDHHVVATLVERNDAHWIIDVQSDEPTFATLERVGLTPLPPYILKARRDAAIDVQDEADRAWYQTVYASSAHAGSVAAPTAGLHFTRELLTRIDAAGIDRETITLHVGPGTFKPIDTETVQDHPMHREWYEIPPATLQRLVAHRADPNSTRVIGVGTTSIRALESLPDDVSTLPTTSASGSTDLLIAPPYNYRHTDGMLTNFHLPRSTLLALVGAMVGLDRLLACYREAVDNAYRFYSYGDAMLIVPSL
ncbi:MAG: tRNA preQ1(34) S-adenosylmethionine ribosyltransferase-isomerase QueA [Planctomycetota bacterium]